MSLRIGPIMLAVLAHVRDHTGCTKGEAAAAAGGTSLRAGYAAVDRCIREGLIGAEPVHQGHPRYRLWITALGRTVLDRPDGG